MAMILNKKEEAKDELSRKINADIRAKMAEGAKIGNAEPDFAEDSEYVKDFQKTGKFGWVWILVAAVVILAVILLSIK